MKAFVSPTARRGARRSPPRRGPPHRIAPSPPESSPPETSAVESHELEFALTRAHRSEAELGKHLLKTTEQNQEIKQLTGIIDQQRLMIATLQGRAVAFNVANQEAALRSSPWSQENARRYNESAKGPPESFADDSLRELLLQAIMATERRVHDAVAASERARATSEQSDNEGDDELYGALNRCLDPTSRAAVQQVIKLNAAKMARHMPRLRTALKKLEEVATAAQSTHYADMRSLAARILAQRDAECKVLANEVFKCESDGYTQSGLLKGLQIECARLSANLQQKTEECSSLQGALKAAKDTIRSERISHREEVGRLNTEVSTLKLNAESLEADLTNALGGMDVPILKAELAEEEKLRHTDARWHGQSMNALLTEHETVVGDLTATLDAMRTEARAMRGVLDAQQREHAQRVQALQQEHSIEIVSLHEERERIQGYLQNKIDEFKKQVRGLRTSTSRGRAEQYWASMKSGDIAAGARRPLAAAVAAVEAVAASGGSGLSRTSSHGSLRFHGSGGGLSEKAMEEYEYGLMNETLDWTTFKPPSTEHREPSRETFNRGTEIPASWLREAMEAAGAKDRGTLGKAGPGRPLPW